MAVGPESITNTDIVILKPSYLEFIRFDKFGWDEEAICSHLACRYSLSIIILCQVKYAEMHRLFLGGGGSYYNHYYLKQTSVFPWAPVCELTLKTSSFLHIFQAAGKQSVASVLPSFVRLPSVTVSCWLSNKQPDLVQKINIALASVHTNTNTSLSLRKNTGYKVTNILSKSCSVATVDFSISGWQGEGGASQTPPPVWAQGFPKTRAGNTSGSVSVCFLCASGCWIITD